MRQACPERGVSLGHHQHGFGPGFQHVQQLRLNRDQIGVVRALHQTRDGSRQRLRRRGASCHAEFSILQKGPEAPHGGETYHLHNVARLRGTGLRGLNQQTIGAVAQKQGLAGLQMGHHPAHQNPVARLAGGLETQQRPRGRQRQGEGVRRRGEFDVQIFPPAHEQLGRTQLSARGDVATRQARHPHPGVHQRRQIGDSGHDELHVELPSSHGHNQQQARTGLLPGHGTDDAGQFDPFIMKAGRQQIVVTHPHRGRQLRPAQSGDLRADEAGKKQAGIGHALDDDVIPWLQGTQARVNLGEEGAPGFILDEHGRGQIEGRDDDAQADRHLLRRLHGRLCADLNSIGQHDRK